MNYDLIYTAVATTAAAVIAVSGYDYHRYITRNDPQDDGPRLRAWAALSTFGMTWLLGIGVIDVNGWASFEHHSSHGHEALFYMPGAVALLVARVMLLWHIQRHSRKEISDHAHGIHPTGRRHSDP